ncbi:hypothetical protein GCM10011360_18800 [Primorskyibacter flagellatus]|uniref:Uncharacterized protein n=1 Tax=Primorskyibacter flagellatus TaxID=1387277 RepID=A0A917EEA6_9RHOB|nr:pilus assembly protein PilZ [Primorskyibacter flagellatus]GGE31064.1 hypothetical protein GCM10011360_18800 [Primorskyibacter flagellatus]
MAGTPGKVAELATEENALDLGGVALLGTMVDGARRSALLRLAGGSVQKVAPGDRIGLVKVQAIGEGVVVISGFGGTETLRMPEG